MSHTIRHVTVRQALEQQSGGAVYLDVRSIPEFEQGHPAGAFNVPLLHADPASGQMRPNPDFLPVVRANFPPDTPMVIGCRSGQRSQHACEILSTAGFHDVANVLGGFSGSPQMGQRGWVQEGLPVDPAPDASRQYAALQKKASEAR
jgi:rhodanese-related sulfurtransferase